MYYKYDIHHRVYYQRERKFKRKDVTQNEKRS